MINGKIAKIQMSGVNNDIFLIFTKSTLPYNSMKSLPMKSG